MGMSIGARARHQIVGGSRSSEDRLLLACVRRRGDPIEIRTLLGSNLDWERLLGAATHLGIAPLVYTTLMAMADRATVPPAVMERSAHLYYRQAMLNGRRYGELRKILAECARAGIRVLVLKGAAIAERVYGNIALCPMRDLDFMVERNDLAATDRLLREMGYVPDESCHSAAWYRDHHHHLTPYGRPDRRAWVEVHHHILPPPASVRIPVEDLWRRARPISAGGALGLCPEDLLLHLCLHVSMQHQFCLGLRPVCDIAATIGHYGDEIDWKQVRHRTCQWAVRKSVYLTLRLARDLVDAAVPEDLLDSLQPEGFDPQVIVWARAQIFADERPIPSPPSNLAQLCGPKGAREKGALFLQSVFPSPKVMAELYRASPDSKRIYLYYPVRWRDLLRRHGRSAWRFLRRDDVMMDLAERENQKTALSDWLASVQ